LGGKCSSLAVGSSWEEEEEKEKEVGSCEVGGEGFIGFLSLGDMLYSSMTDGVGELMFVYSDEATKQRLSMSTCRHA
jgi:hypothetical protein